LEKKRIVRFGAVVVLLLLAACAGSLKLGDQYFEGKNYQQAISAYRAVLAKDSTNVKAWVRLGKSYQAVGKLDSARWSLKKAASLNPDDAAIRQLVLDNDFQMAKKMAADTTSRWEAIREFSALLKRDSTYLPARLERARLYEAVGQLDLAEKDYKTALNENPVLDSLRTRIASIDKRRTQSVVWTKKGEQALRKRKYLTAIQDLTKALRLKPDNERAQYLLHMAKGQYYTKRGKLSRIWDAIGEFGKAAALEPKNPEPHYYMAKAYYKKDKRDYENTIREYQEVVKLAPQSALAQKARVQIKKLKKLQSIWKRFWGK
jgi:Tfp pilus assembly protein PilF